VTNGWNNHSIALLTTTGKLEAEVDADHSHLLDFP
jgi:hypothetical protein